MKTRKIFALLLAALFILAAVPAWAVIGSEIHNTTYQGANVLREGKALPNRITSSITLSFTPGVQHLPESDYTPKRASARRGTRPSPRTWDPNPHP